MYDFGLTYELIKKIKTIKIPSYMAQIPPFAAIGTVGSAHYWEQTATC